MSKCMREGGRDERPNGRPPHDEEEEAPGEYSPEDVKRQLSR